MRGREITLTPRPGFRLPSLAHVAEGIAARPDELLDLESAYYDTPDLRLTRAGVALSRQGDAWIVELPGAGASARATTHRMVEATGAPPSGALDLLCAYTRGAAVGPVVRLKTRRRRVQLDNGDHSRIAEVVDDEVTVLEGSRITARFRELDVVLDAEAPPALAETLVARLRAAGAGSAPPRSPLAQALGAHALEPADVALPPGITGSSDIRSLVTATIARSVAQLVAHDAGVRLGEDPEAVHQARVATRRLRSDLRTFRDLLEPSWDRAQRDELRWLGTLLGGVRDTEVLRDLMRSEVARLAPDERRIGEALLDELAVRRHEARLLLLDGLRSPRYVRVLDRLVDAARRPALRPDVRGPAGEWVPALLRAPWRHLVRSVGALGVDPPDAALHELRVRTKRLRYAVEAAAPVAGDAVARVGRRAAALQDVLGRHQDAVVASAWLRGVARNATTRPEAFTAGELAGLVRAEELATRAEWPRAWHRLRRQARRALP